MSGSLFPLISPFIPLVALCVVASNNLMESKFPIAWQNIGSTNVFRGYAALFLFNSLLSLYPFLGYQDVVNQILARCVVSFPIAALGFVPLVVFLEVKGKRSIVTAVVCLTVVVLLVSLTSEFIAKDTFDEAVSRWLRSLMDVAAYGFGSGLFFCIASRTPFFYFRKLPR